jgi:hypothetical protein
VDIAAGKGIIVDNYTDAENPTYTEVTWNAQEAVTLNYINLALATFLAVNASGDIVQQTTAVNAEEERELITLGLVAHTNLTFITNVNNYGNWGKDILLTLGDLSTVIGPRLNDFGNDFTANGANLKLDKSAGSMFGMGLNYKDNKQLPNSKAIDADSALTILTLYRDTPIPTIVPTDNVPNTHYDPNGDGNLVAIPADFYTAHRIYYEPSTGVTILQYGQYIYDSLKKGVMSWDKEDFDKSSAIAGVPLRTVIIIKQGCTELNDPDLAKFIQRGLLGDKNLDKIVNYSEFAENIEIIDGMSYQRPSIAYLTSTGDIYADIESITSSDIIYAFNQKEYILDCTTGAGVNGKARVQLTQGTATDPVQNYIYVTVESDGVATLNVSTTFPTGQFGWVADVLMPDDTTFDSVGAYSSQRYSDNKSHNGRGALSYEREKIRSLGTSYESGVVPTITIVDLTPTDSLDISTTPGEIYQLHKQTFPTRDSSVDGIFIINHPTDPWLNVTALEDIQVDANGDSLNNTAFNFVFVGINSSADGDQNYSQLGVLLPNGSYGYTQLTQALADEENTAITSVPTAIKKTAFLIARVTFKYKNGVWNNVVEDETATTFFDLRGLPIGATSGGAGTPSVTDFSDSAFSIFNVADTTKIINFSAANITTGQTRTITMADRSLDLAAPIFDSLVINNQATFNASQGAYNFTINKQTTGTALQYDATADQMNIDSNLYITADSLLTGTSTVNTKLVVDDIDERTAEHGVMVNNKFGVNTATTTLTNWQFRAHQDNTDTDVSVAVNTSVNGSTSQTDYWQSFTVTEDGKLKKITYEATGSAPQSCTINIYEGEGTGGQLLTTQTHTHIGSGTGTITLDTAQDVTAAAQYTVRFTAAANMGFTQSTVNPYAGGRNSVNANYDSEFESFVREATGTIDFGFSDQYTAYKFKALTTDMNDVIDRQAIILGDDESTNNVGVLAFDYTSAGSASNYLGLGLYNAEDVIKIYPAETEINVTTFDLNATTTTIDGTDININSDVSVTGSVDIVGDLDIDNININTNTISPTDTNGTINIIQDGSGTVVIGDGGGNIQLDNFTYNNAQTNFTADAVFQGTNTKRDASSGDHDIQFGDVDFTIGVDVTDTNSFCIANSNVLGTSNMLKFENGANAGIDITTKGSGTLDITAPTNITGDLDVDNININSDTISNTATNNDINILPNGTGSVYIGDGNVTSNLGMLVLDGTTESVEGPHIATFVSGDNTYPVMQMLSYSHDNAQLSYDAYWNGTWKSADPSSNYQLRKASDIFYLRYGKDTTQGNTITWHNGYYVNKNGSLFVGNTTDDQNRLITIQTDEDATVVIEADADNTGEDDNPSIYFSQDGGAVTGRLGFQETNNDMFFRNDYSASDMIFQTNGVNERLRINSSGNFIFGNASTLTALAVYNTGVSGRDCWVSSAGLLGWNVLSMREAKTNIQPITGWEGIYQLTCVDFNIRKTEDQVNGITDEVIYNSDTVFTDEYNDELQHGLIAEDVMPLFPEVVYKDGEKAVGMSYERLITPMIKCIQMQKEKIDELEARIHALEN